MLFNSYAFLFGFLPVTVVVFFLASRVRREAGTLWLVLASLFFYGYWDYHYVPLLLGSIIFNYVVGGQLERYANAYPIERGGHVDPAWPGTRQRRAWLAFGVVVNVALLGYFKYTDFFLGTVNTVAGTMLELPHIVLPLGISFFTFTQTAYLVDAYRGQAARHTWLTYFEFVTIFPHLIAGPIIHHREMIPQFLAERTFVVNWKNIYTGLAIFILGLAKKVCIADSLSPWANALFTQAESLTLVEAWLGVLSYTLQLYFDFSGYSEMAIGLGLMLNLRLPQNFDSPYQSRSIIDFWRRWHMTLGLWVKNYLYIPMGGNRHGQLAKMRNLFVSMLLIGLWHGAGWTYVVWGAWHGVMLMVNHWWRGLQIALPGVLCWLLTFGGVVIGWVFFRAASFADAGAILTAMVGGHGIMLPAGGFYEQHLAFLSAVGVHFGAMVLPAGLPVMVVTTLLLLVIVVLVGNPIRWWQQERISVTSRWQALGMLFGLTLLLLSGGESEFLYFQF